MNDALVEEGWVAPGDPGPTRRHAAVVVAVSVVVLVAWLVVIVHWPGGDRASTSIDVGIGIDGTITVDGDALETEQRQRAGVTFLVAQAELAASDDVEPDVAVPAGIGPEQVVVRVLQPQGGIDTASLLVTVPLASFDPPLAASAEPAQLAQVTAPLDERIREQRDDRRFRDQLVDRAPWIALVVLVVLAIAPLLLWRRARRRWFSMRRPGPGTALGIEPPSSLDPVGAAILVAGARPVDAASAFAGQVLDLVERRLLPMRRSTETPPGIGTLIGMHHAGEVESAAIAPLESMLASGETSVLLPDNPAKVRTATPAARTAWNEHVEARAAFESAVVRPPMRRLQLLVAASIVLVVSGVVAARLTDLDGRRALAWLVAGAAFVLATSIGAWLLDARRWRTVTRPRRLERAQWLAWRDGAAQADGPASDQRNLAVLVAVDAPLTHVRGGASATAVDLDAATTRSIESLRRALGDA